MIVEVPGLGEIEFPDGTPPDVMRAAIQRALARRQQTVSAPPTRSLADLSGDNLSSLLQKIGVGPETASLIGGGFTAINRPVNRLANAMSFGVTDEAAGAGAATAARATGADPTAAYDAAAGAERREKAQFDADNPVAGFAMDIGGGLLAGAPRAAATALTRAPGAVATAADEAASPLVRRMLTGAGYGAGFGAAAGAGNADGGDRIGGGVAGAAFGGAAGAATPAALAALGGAWGAIAPRLGLRNDDTASFAKLLRAFEDDGITPEDAAARLQGWVADGGKPAALFDLGGENVRGLARAIGGTPSRAKNDAVTFVRDRLDGTASRVADDAQGALAGGKDYRSTFDAIRGAREAQARPLFAAADAEPFTFNDEVRGLLERPALKAALPRAMRIMENRGVDPKSLGLTFNDAGDPVFESVPSFQALRYVKQGLDDVLEGYRDKTTGRLVLDTEGSGILDLRNTFVQALRDANPKYGPALDAYAGDSALMDALSRGRSVFAPAGAEARDTLTRSLDKMNAAEREAYRLGVFQAIDDRITNLRDGSDPTKAIFGTQALRNRIAAAFDDPKQFDAFETAVKREAELYRNAQAVSPRTGSQSDLRAGERAALSDAGDISGALLAGSPENAAMSILRSAARGKPKSLERAVADRLAPELFTSDPTRVQGALDSLVRLRGQLARSNAAKIGGEALGRGLAIGAANSQAPRPRGLLTTLP